MLPFTNSNVSFIRRCYAADIQILYCNTAVSDIYDKKVGHHAFGLYSV